MMQSNSMSFHKCALIMLTRHRSRPSAARHNANKPPENRDSFGSGALLASNPDFESLEGAQRKLYRSRGNVRNRLQQSPATGIEAAQIQYILACLAGPMLASLRSSGIQPCRAVLRPRDSYTHFILRMRAGQKAAA